MKTQKNFPRWAKKYLGENLLSRISSLINVGHEFDELMEGLDVSEKLKLFIESGDVCFLIEMLIEIGDEIIDTALAKSVHRTDWCNRLTYITGGIQEIMASQRPPHFCVAHNIAEGLAAYVSNRVFTHLIFDAFATSPDPDVWNADILPDNPMHQLFNSVRSIRSTLDYLVQKVGLNHFAPLRDSDTALAASLGRGAIHLNRLTGLPPIRICDIFAGTQAGSYFTSVSGYASLGKPHLTGMSPTLIHVVNPEDLADEEPVDYSEIARDQENPGFRISMFFSPQSFSFMLGHDGEGLCLGRNCYIPIVKVLNDSGTLTFYRQLQLRIMLEIHELYEHLFQAIKSTLREQSEDKDADQTIVRLPDKYQPSYNGSTETVLPIAPQDLQERVETHQALAGGIDFPSLTANKILRSLRKLGCDVVRQTGSHMLVRAPNGQKRPLPQHNKSTIGIGLLINLLKAFEISRLAFLENL